MTIQDKKADGGRELSVNPDYDAWLLIRNIRSNIWKS
jgi:hypothetical protein